jgi:hypothetical protein
VEGFFPPPMDAAAIARAAGETHIIATDTDDYATFEQSKAYADRLRIPIHLLAGAGHISPYWGYGEWPWVRDWCLGRATFRRSRAPPTRSRVPPSRRRRGFEQQPVPGLHVAGVYAAQCDHRAVAGAQDGLRAGRARHAAGHSIRTVRPVLREQGSARGARNVNSRTTPSPPGCRPAPPEPRRIPSVRSAPDNAVRRSPGR